MLDDMAVGVPVILGFELVDGSKDCLFDKDGFELVDGPTEDSLVGRSVVVGREDTDGDHDGRLDTLGSVDKDGTVDIV